MPDVTAQVSTSHLTNTRFSPPTARPSPILPPIFLPPTYADALYCFFLIPSTISAELFLCSRLCSTNFLSSGPVACLSASPDEVSAPPRFRISSRISSTSSSNSLPGLTGIPRVAPCKFSWLSLRVRPGRRFERALTRLDRIALPGDTRNSEQAATATMGQ